MEKMSIIKKNKNERVMMFIDLRNIENKMQDLASRGIFGARIDYEELATELVGERDLVAAYVFDSCCESDSKYKFIIALQRLGFRAEIRKFDKNQTEQKEVDVALATRLVSCAYKDLYDTAIVVSGDRDFVPAIEEVQSLGKKVEAAAFIGSTSYSMENIPDVYTSLDKLIIIDITYCRQIYEEEIEASMTYVGSMAEKGEIA